jgi:mono/diheme cytochrome c family protein
MKRVIGAISVAILGAAVAGWLTLGGGAQSPKSVSAKAEADAPTGQALYGEKCAVCHGANLEGQPDWQSPDEDGVYPAPPHDASGHTWHHADPMLFEYIKIGGQAALDRQGVAFNSGMPGFGDQLTDDQIRSILDYIKSTWPERERNMQAQRTEAEAQQEEN